MQVTLHLLSLPLQVTLHLLPLSLKVTLRLLPLPMPQDQMILMSMVLVYLLSLPLVFVCFLHITLLKLKIKSKPMKIRINHQNDVIFFRKIYNKLSSFDGKKNIEDSIKDWLIITATTTRIFFALKAANVKPPKASLDAMDIVKLAEESVERCWWNIMQSTKNGSTSSTTKIL